MFEDVFCFCLRHVLNDLYIFFSFVFLQYILHSGIYFTFSIIYFTFWNIFYILNHIYIFFSLFKFLWYRLEYNLRSQIFLLYSSLCIYVIYTGIQFIFAMIFTFFRLFYISVVLHLNNLYFMIKKLLVYSKPKKKFNDYHHTYFVGNLQSTLILVIFHKSTSTKPGILITEI